MEIKHNCKKCKELSKYYKKESEDYKELSSKISEGYKKESEYYAEKCRCEVEE